MSVMTIPEAWYYRTGRSLDAFFEEIPPELVVEVASPRTRLYDRNRKKDVYEGFGIPAYWIVEPDLDHPSLTVFELRSGTYEQAAHVTGDQEYRTAIPFPVTVDAAPRTGPGAPRRCGRRVAGRHDRGNQAVVPALPGQPG